MIFVYSIPPWYRRDDTATSLNTHTPWSTRLGPARWQHGENHHHTGPADSAESARATGSESPGTGTGTGTGAGAGAGAGAEAGAGARAGGQPPVPSLPPPPRPGPPRPSPAPSPPFTPWLAGENQNGRTNDRPTDECASSPDARAERGLPNRRVGIGF